jgi:hypothetical protein
MPSSTGVRLILKFNFAQLIRASGWSEGYDLGYADLPTAVAALGNITAFIYDRVYCLGIGPYLASATLSSFTQPSTPGAPPVRRSTLAIPVPTIPNGGFAYNKNFDPANFGFLADFSPTVFYISLQTSLSGSPVYRRSCWIAGLPDGSDQTNQGYVTEPNTVTALQKFLGDLQNSGTNVGAKNTVSIRSIDRSNANPIKQCTGWNLLTNTYSVPAHGFVVGQPVLAEGMKTTVGGQAPRGRYLIGAVIDSNTIALQDSLPPTSPIKFGGFRAAVNTFNGVAIATGKGFTKRDKGRLFFQSVGRRPKPLIRRA